MIYSSSFDPFGEFPLESRIVARAAASGIEVEPQGAAMLAAHARAVLRINPELHLTSITQPEEFLERHIGEGFEGAALLPADIRGTLLDLGSGNGYPGLAIAAARPGLDLLMAEASPRKAGFQRQTLRDLGHERVLVFEAQVQRASDIEALGRVRVITCRAMGGWAKIVPRLAPALVDDGDVLLWAGEEFEAIVKRVVWRKFSVEERKALPGRSRSWIWRMRKAAAGNDYSSDTGGSVA